MTDVVEVIIGPTEVVEVFTGAPGTPGAPGASAYQTAVDEGFVGDEAAWLASLRGLDGEDGSDGEDGAPGPSAVSADVGNAATLGSDDLIYVPESAGAVSSVNGESGVVVLTQDDIADGTTAKQYTSAEKTKLAGIASGATANSSDATLLARANHSGTQSADTLTDGTTNKAFLATERTKLAGIASAATANDTDANLKARGNHTGTQTASTISDFATAADARVAAGLTPSGSANNPHTTKTATRNAALPKNFWQYTGVDGVDNPTNAINGDEWISA